jgi:hypothetical protein
MKQTYTITLAIFWVVILVLWGPQSEAEIRGSANGAGGFLDLRGAAIMVDSGDESQMTAAEFLRNEVFSRTGLRLPVNPQSCPAGTPEIVLALAADRPPPSGICVPAKMESFAIWIESSGAGARIILSGRDHLGLLFAAGRLVRELYLTDHYISLHEETRIASAPADEMRAQQILNNAQCEDGFMDWEDPVALKGHINELVLFGLNGIETTSPELVDDYLEEMGLDLHIRLNCQKIIDLDALSDPEIVSHFDGIKGVDHIMSYGGDARGAVRPQLFFPHMGRVVPLVLQGQPGAKWWYSNQCLEDHAKDYDDYIFSYLQEHRPPWMYGMVYGPWTRRGIPEIRKDLPSQYEIRRKPDICHPRWSQYPVPEWDRGFAMVWPRNKSIYAMPGMMRAIYLANRDLTIGSIPYNHTGSYNDLNKFVWVYAGWDPEAPVEEALEAYARLFFVHGFIQYPQTSIPNDESSLEERLDAAASYVVKAFQLLEENWQVPLKDNTSSEAALEHWRNIAEWSGGAALNWRVEMFLYKARIDAQIKRKYDFEMSLEKEALEVLEQAEEMGFERSVRMVENILGRIETDFQTKEDFLSELKTLGLTDKFGDLDEIADNLYSSFNDRYWILDHLEKSATARDLISIVQYEDPGDGGYYDNLGVPGEQPHLVRPLRWRDDPGFVHSNIDWVDNALNSELRHSRHTHVVSRYETPLKMSWDNLDPRSPYRIRVVYNGPFGVSQQCHTDEGILVHPFVVQSKEIRTFLIPASATSDGKLTLQWTQDTSDVKRGVSVSEIWLEKENGAGPQ